MLKQKSKKVSLILLLAVMLLLRQGGLPVKAETSLLELPVSAAQGVETVPGEIIVKLSDSVDLTQDAGTRQVEEIADENGVSAEEAAADDDNVVVFKTAENAKAVTEKIEELSGDPRVEYAQPNYVYRSFGIASNDTYKDTLWGLDNVGQVVNGTTGTANADVNAPEAWTITEGAGSQLIAAVIDEGVSYDHPDLNANMWDGSACVGNDGTFWGGCLHGYDFLENDKDPLEGVADTHGTIVSGVLGAAKNNGVGVIGVAPHVKIMALRVGGGNQGFTTNEIVKAIAFAKNNGAKIINASWGGGQNDLVLRSAIESFNGLFVTSAGNELRDNAAVPIYPCNFDLPNIICAAATDQNDQLWVDGTMGSNWGSSSVDLGAPGMNVISTASTTQSGYAITEGTSIAAPFVAGAAALVWAQNPAFSAAQVKTQILGTGDILPALAGKTLTGRRLNLFAALGGTGISVQNSDPFVNTDIAFKDEEVKDGKTRLNKVKLKFENFQNAAQFIMSRRADFAGSQWETITDGKKVSIKSEAGKTQSFYVKFRNSNGIESRVFKKKVQYASAPKRQIKNSRSSVKIGATLIQRGYGFSKNSKVELHFGSSIAVVNANSKGAFQVAYKANKIPGKYAWYAVDLKTGKKSKQIAYKVVR